MPDWYFAFENRGNYRITVSGPSRDLEDEDIINVFTKHLEQERLRPFLERIRCADQAQHQQILNRFDRATVWRWLNGSTVPPHHTVQTVKRILGIAANGPPASEPSEADYRSAWIKTLYFIRGCRHPPLAEPTIELDEERFEILEFAVPQIIPGPKSALRDQRIAALAKKIGERFASSRIAARESLEGLLDEWFVHYMILIDALES